MEEAEEFIDFGLIASFEDYDWRAPRDDGLSDEQIWDSIVDAAGDRWEQIKSRGRRQALALLLFEIHELRGKRENDAFSQTSVDWVRNGWIITHLAADCGLRVQGRRAFYRQEGAYVARKQQAMNPRAI